MANTYLALLDATVAALAGLGLPLGAVRRQKLPTAEESLDGPFPLLFVVPSPEPVRSEPFATARASGRPAKLNEYAVGLSRVTQGNRDPQAGLGDALDWRQAAAALFGVAKSVPVAGLLTTRVALAPAADARAWREGYDLSRLDLFFSCVE